MRDLGIRFGHGIAVCSAAVTRFLLHKSLCILFALVTTTARAGSFDSGPYRQALQAGIDSGAYDQLAIGWIDGAERATWLLGKAAKPDIHSRFEIGALTEIFTGLLFAQAAIDGKIGQHATLHDAMPHQTFEDPRIGRLALDALASHQTALPAIPPNLFPADVDDPFAGVTSGDVSAFLGNYRMRDLTPRYSPLDAGVLGVAVAHAYDGEFDAVLKERILTPLGMSDTGFDDAGLLDGHSHGQVAAHWHFGALAGSAGLRSTLSDLMDFLQANLQPQQSPTLRAALLLVRQPRLDAKSQAGLGWNIVDAGSDGQTWPLLWRASTTAGFSAFVGFRTDRQQALVILSDTDSDVSRIGLAWLQKDDAPGAPMPSSIVSAPGDLGLYAGLYRFSADASELVVRAQSGSITAQLQGSPTVRLRNVANDVFIARGDALTLSFQRERDKVTSVLVNRGGVNLMAERLSAQTPRLARKVMSMRADKLADYAGDYHVDANTFVRVTVDGGGLSLQLTGRAAISLAPFAEDRFTDVDNSCEVRFERAKDGKVDHIVMNFAGADRSGVREVWSASDTAK
jgi:D-alanyl-D-alanine-carboxypeptidase/D-alanyl-D-alanine-endopeptidase